MMMMVMKWSHKKNIDLPNLTKKKFDVKMISSENHYLILE